MADELNIPTHRWYQKRNHVALAKEDFSRQFIYDSGIQKIDAWINSQPWGDVYIVNRLSPKMVFDFDENYFRTEGTATDLVSAATHTRASSATYVDASGILQTAAINEPRVGHHIWNGTAWVDEGYFHESEARTNLYSSSNDFSTGTVFVADEVATAQDETGPDGLTSAWTISDDGVSGVSGTSRIALAQVATTSGDYTASFYLKAGNNSWIYLSNANWNIGNGQTYFNLSDGTIGTVQAGVTPNIEDVGNGFFRCSVTMTETTGGVSSRTFLCIADEDGNQFITQDGTNSIIAYGAQFEVGSTPSSYIPTAGATVTRAADAMTIPAANLPWNPLAVSIQMEGTMTYADTDTAFEVVFYDWELNTSNYIDGFVGTIGAATGYYRTRQALSGTVDNSASTTNYYSPGINVPFNIASRHGSTFINGAVDGTALTADLTPTALPYLENTDMQIGSTFNGTIKLVRVWADDLTDEGIAEASA